MNWRAVASKAFFRHPDIRVYTVQAFISGLCGVVLFLAVVSLNMSYWPTIMVGYFPHRFVERGALTQGRRK